MRKIISIGFGFLVLIAPVIAQSELQTEEQLLAEAERLQSEADSNLQDIRAYILNKNILEEDEMENILGGEYKSLLDKPGDLWTDFKESDTTTKVKTGGIVVAVIGLIYLIVTGFKSRKAKPGPEPSSALVRAEENEVKRLENDLKKEKSDEKKLELLQQRKSDLIQRNYTLATRLATDLTEEAKIELVEIERELKKHLPDEEHTVKGLFERSRRERKDSDALLNNWLILQKMRPETAKKLANMYQRWLKNQR